MTVCSTSKSSYWLLNCDVLISNIHDFAGLSMRWPRVALITRRRVALAACRLRGPHFLHMECHKQHLSMHCVLPLSPSSVSSQPLLHEKTAERIPAFNNSSLVYPLSIRQNPINLCSIESFTFWIIYIYYIYISLSATAPGNTCLARASKMRTEYDSSKSIYFGLFCLPFKLSMSLFLFLFLCLEDRQHFPSQSVSISRSSIGYDQSYINHLKSSDPAPRAIAAIAPFFP